jgi:hypothetical protein
VHYWHKDHPPVSKDPHRLRLQIQISSLAGLCWGEENVELKGIPWPTDHNETANTSLIHNKQLHTDRLWDSSIETMALTTTFKDVQNEIRHREKRVYWDGSYQ